MNIPDDIATIAVQGLGYSVEGKQILTGISFSTQQSRIGVIGRNGSGKSSLARALAGLITPDAGTVHIAGIDVARDRKGALGAVGILFQNPDHQIIFPTVAEELAFGLRQQGQAKDGADAMVRTTLEGFGKAHWYDVSIQTLSQGQRQLVCLMAILAMRPQVLILDEPFAGLDIPTRMQLGRYLARSQATLVHVTHDPQDLAGYDRVLWLDQGQLRDDGLAAQVLDRFTLEMTQIGAGDDISDLSG